MQSLRRIPRGGAVTFNYLNQFEAVVLDNQRGIALNRAAVVDAREQGEGGALRPDQLLDERANRAAAEAADVPPLILTETDRTTATVRVTNPEDAEQYVDVTRVESVTFIDADGVTTTLSFNNAG